MHRNLSSEGRAGKERKSEVRIWHKYMEQLFRKEITMFPFQEPPKRLFSGLRPEDLSDPRAHAHAVKKAEVLAARFSPRLNAALTELRGELSERTLKPFEEASKWAYTLD